MLELEERPNRDFNLGRGFFVNQVPVPPIKYVLWDRSMISGNYRCGSVQCFDDRQGLCLIRIKSQEQKYVCAADNDGLIGVDRSYSLLECPSCRKL